MEQNRPRPPRFTQSAIHGIGQLENGHVSPDSHNLAVRLGSRFVGEYGSFLQHLDRPVTVGMSNRNKFIKTS